MRPVRERHPIQQIQRPSVSHDPRLIRRTPLSSTICLQVRRHPPPGGSPRRLSAAPITADCAALGALGARHLGGPHQTAAAAAAA